MIHQIPRSRFYRRISSSSPATHSFAPRIFLGGLTTQGFVDLVHGCQKFDVGADGGWGNDAADYSRRFTAPLCW
jgi:hypothetical protein